MWVELAENWDLGPPGSLPWSATGWRENKQQLIWWPELALLALCLVSLHSSATSWRRSRYSNDMYLVFLDPVSPYPKIVQRVMRVIQFESSLLSYWQYLFAEYGILSLNKSYKSIHTALCLRKYISRVLTRLIKSTHLLLHSLKRFSIVTSLNR